MLKTCIQNIHTISDRDMKNKRILHKLMPRNTTYTSSKKVIFVAYKILTVMYLIDSFDNGKYIIKNKILNAKCMILWLYKLYILSS